MISDLEQADHSRSHIAAAVRHLQAAGEHLDSWADNADLQKMAGAHLAKAGQEIGSAVAQHAMAKKHVDSLIGREGWDGEADLETSKASINQMAHDLKMAGEHHAALSEAVHDENAARAVKRHKDLKEHLDKASATGNAFVDSMGKAIEARGRKSEKASVPQIAKGRFLVEGDHFQLFIPITKMRDALVKDDSGKETPTLIVEGCASVADYVDDQQDVPTAEFIKKAMEEWAPFGNIRLQHDPKAPIGTIHNPVIGKFSDDIEPCGWWMEKHPVTGTDAAFIRCHIVDDKAIKLFKAGVLTGFSVGGSLAPNGSQVVEAEIDETGRILYDATQGRVAA